MSGDAFGAMQAVAVTPLDRLVQLALCVAYRLRRTWWWLMRPTLRGALVAVWHEDRLLLIRNSYRDGETLPSGGANRGETPREAARRELAEEVGLAVPEQRLRFAGELEFWSEHKHSVDSVFELLLSEAPELRLDGREVVAAAFVPRPELPDRPLHTSVRAYLERHSGKRGVKTAF